MLRPGLPVFGLATLVVLAGCGGVVGPGTPTASSPQSPSRSADSSLQELENATLWIDGSVQRIENGTVYIDDQPYSDTVVPVLVRENSVVFSCDAGNGSGSDCRPLPLAEVQPGAKVCAFVYVRSGTIQAGKVFVHAVCGGPQVPPQ